MKRLLRCGGALISGTALVVLMVSPASFGLPAASAATTVAATTNVSIVDFNFLPPTVTVAVGDTVTWTDNVFSHSVTSEDGSFDSSPTCPPTCLAHGTTFSHVFNTAGSFPYYCRLHGGPGGIGMSGRVIVQQPTQFHSVTPARIQDSRGSSQVGPYSTPWGPGTVRDIAVAGHGGVPADADAVVLNVTATGTTAASFLTIWPTDAPRPLASNLNWVLGQTIPNQVTVKLGTGGKVSIYNPGGNVDVVADVNGYYTAGAGGDGFTSLTPARIEDSRPSSQVGPYSTPWGPGTVRDVAVGGAGGVPADADAVVLNVTATGTTAASFLTIWPTDSPQPLASNLNWVPGQTIPNQVTVKLGTGGNISVYNPGGHVDVVADVAGFLKAGTGKSFHVLPPARVQDSRPATQVGFYSTPWAQGTTRDVAVAGLGGVPGDAEAAALNVTVTDTTAASFLTIWPEGATQPVASSLNWVGGQTIPNVVASKLGTNGSVSVYNPGGNVDVIADVNGYYG